MKKRELKKRLTAWAMAVCLLGTAIVLPASAETTEHKEAIAYEEMGERDENTKVFRKADDTLVAVTSGAPLHYQKDGRWVEIDNTLKAAKNKAGDRVLTNLNNPYAVELPERLSSESAVTLKKDGYALSFAMLDMDGASKKAQVKKQVPNKDASSAEKRAELQKRSATVTYKDVWDGASIEYIVGAKTLKENIILKRAPDAPVQYRYRITADGLTAQLQKDHSVRPVPKRGKPGGVYHSRPGDAGQPSAVVRPNRNRP